MNMILNYPFENFTGKHKYCITAAGQLLVMLYLGLKGGECGIVYCSHSKLIEATKIDSQGINYILDVLEEQNLIKKIPMPESAIFEITINAEKLAKAQCYEK